MYLQLLCKQLKKRVKTKEELKKLKARGKVTGYFGVSKIGHPREKKFAYLADPIDLIKVSVTPKAVSKDGDV